MLAAGTGVAASLLSRGTEPVWAAITIFDSPGGTGNLRVRDSTATRYRSDWFMLAGGAGALMNAFDDTGGVYLPFQLDASKTVLGMQGNVGVGALNPPGRLTLDVTPGTTPAFRIRDATATRYRSDWSMIGGGGGALINAFDDTAGVYLPLKIDASTTILGQAGNVGIGTTAPSSRLTVVAASGDCISASTTSGFCVRGDSANASGVLGFTGTGEGVVGDHFGNGTNPGVRGDTESTSPQAVGVLGRVTSGTVGAGSAGVLGENKGTGTSGSGVLGRHSGSGDGVFGFSPSGVGVVGATGIVGFVGSAGLFIGDVTVNGNLTKTSGQFRIDHPLDPAIKYLQHSFVESPDMKNIYDGVVELDENGEASVELPVWFDALNRDFRYQLTAVGGAMPDLHVASEVSSNRFKIAGGKAGMKVSWLLTGIRKDPYANAHRIPVEQNKPEAERGFYLYPELYGEPKEKKIGWERIKLEQEVSA